MTAPVCLDCNRPAVPRPSKTDRCAECAAIANDIANQKAAAMVAAIRTLKAAQRKEIAA